MYRLLMAMSCVLVSGGLTAQVATLPLKNGAEKEIYRTMVRRLESTRVSVAWEDVGLGETIRRMGRSLRFNMVLGKALRDREEEPVTLQLKDVSVMTVVRLLKQQFDIEFQHRHGVMVVTTTEDAMQRAMVLRIYGIRLITYTPPDFPAPGILGLRPGPPPEPPEEGEAREPRFDPDFVVDLVRSTTGGEKVWEVEGASISHHNGKLLVRHAPHIQARVRRILDRLR